jgi:predicted esterase
MPTRVLCLHGCCQSEEMFRSLLKTWIRIGEKDHDLEFHFLQATTPHSNGGWTWYTKELDVSAIGTLQYDPDMQNPCLDRVHAYVREHKIDVLLGFSQGGNVVDTYLYKYDMCGPVQRGVIFSGYEMLLSGDRVRPGLGAPMLSVYSDADEIVPSKFRPKHYLALAEFAHTKGHRLPSGNKTIRALCQYMRTGGFTPPN